MKIATAGTVGSGKSTLVTACAKTDPVKKLLALRQASGGTKINTNIYVTDYEKIPEDKLLMTAVLSKKAVAEISDDNEMLGCILLAAAKTYKKNPDEKLYKKKIENTLKDEINNSDKDSLAFIIKNIISNMTSEDRDEKFKELVDLFLAFPIDYIMRIYEIMIVRTSKNSSEGINIFNELLCKYDDLKVHVNNFWYYVVELVNDNIDKFKVSIDDYAYFEKKDDKIKFYIALGDNDVKTGFAKKILGADYINKYLFSDISLIFRGRDNFFNKDKNINCSNYTVAYNDSVPIHCFNLIDTRGFSYVDDADIVSESDYIFDLLSEYNCNRLILVINSYLSDTENAFIDAIKKMFKAFNRELYVNILFTHTDICASSLINQAYDDNIFYENYKTNSDDISKKFESEFKIIADQLTEAFNLKKHSGFFYYYISGFLSSNKSVNGKLLYPIAIEKIIINFSESVNGGGCHVEGYFAPLWDNTSWDIYELDFLPIIGNVKNFDNPALYKNLVGECIGLKLSASTVRESIYKWLLMGDSYISHELQNNSGFQNITTFFVREIRNCSLSYIDMLLNYFRKNFNTNFNTIFNTKHILYNDYDHDVFVYSFLNYLKDQQNFGRELARVIGKYAYDEVYKKSNEFKFQYEYFENMLEYTYNKMRSHSTFDILC